MKIDFRNINEMQDTRQSTVLSVLNTNNGASTAQIWWEAVHVGPKYGHMNIYLATMKSV